MRSPFTVVQGWVVETLAEAIELAWDRISDFLLEQELNAMTESARASARVKRRH